MAAGCVTSYEDAPLAGRSEVAAEYAVPVAVPLPASTANEEQRLVAEFYSGILTRMHEAVKERDPAALEFLLESYDRPNVPDYVAEPLRSYRALAKGLRFLQHATARSTLALVEVPAADRAKEPAAIGAPLHFELTLPPGDRPVRLGARTDDDATGFAVAITVEDSYVDGSSRSMRSQEFVWLPAAIVLIGDTSLRLPVAVELGASGSVRRSVHVRVDLMPGYVSIDGVRAPVQRTTLGAQTLTQWPVGHEAIAKAPLAALEQALKRFDAERFATVYLAATAARGEEREKAIELLVEQVRFGRPDQSQVAMAALRAVSGQDLPVGDREAWLAWAQARR